MLVDPDGRDIIIILWATSGEGVGHIGIAVSNYKEIKIPKFEIKNGIPIPVLDKNGKQVYNTIHVKDGTYTLYENWPGGDGVTFNLKGAITSVKADRPVTIIQSEKEFTSGATVSPYEDRAPDGVLKLSTTYDQDMAVKKRLEKANKIKTYYNGAWYNCSSYASDGLKAIFGKKIGRETIFGLINAITPNQFWKDLLEEAQSEKLGVNVLKDPGNKIDNEFVKTIKNKD